MPKDELTVGVHVSASGSLDLAVDRAVQLGCGAFQMFTRNPQGWKFGPIKEEVAASFKEKMKRSGIKEAVSHMPYLPNLATPDPLVFEKSQEALKEELRRASLLGLSAVVMHLGSHLGMGKTYGQGRVALAILQAYSETGARVPILLENTAGQKNSVGSGFDDLRRILELVGDPNGVGVCLDTCMPGWSPVLAPGQLKQIADVSPGDTVYGQDGNTTVVRRVLKRPFDGRLAAVKPMGLPWMHTTMEHPFLCTRIGKIKRLDEAPWRVKTLEPPVWLSAGDLKPGLFLIMPALSERPTPLLDFQPYIGSRTRVETIPRKLELTPGLAELFGLYLAEGFTFMGHRGRSDNGKIYFAFGSHEKGLINRTQRLIEDNFGLSVWLDEEGSVTKVCTGSNPLTRFLRDQFGTESRNKRIPDFMMHAPSVPVYHFIRGYLHGDGHVGRNGITFVTASNSVAAQLVHLLARLDVHSTIVDHAPYETKIGDRVIRSRGWKVVRVGRYDSGKLGVSYHIRQHIPQTVLKDKSHFYIPIRAVNSVPFAGTVYNLTTESGDFLAPHVITHNCHAYAAGYDLTSPSSVEDTLSKFDETVGLQALKLIHLNDSKGGLGCHLDRHENIGKGQIGTAGIRAFLHNEKVRHLPMILETPVAEDGDWGKDLVVVRKLFK